MPINASPCIILPAWAFAPPVVLGLLLMGMAATGGRGHLWRTIRRGNVAVMLGLLPLLLAGLASLIAVVLGTDAGAHGLRSASTPPVHSRWDGVRPGGTWVRTRLILPTNALLSDPYRASLLWAGTADGVWLSPDGGTTWRRAGRGFAGIAVLALAATPSDVIVAGGDDGAVYAGTAGGGTGWYWQRISPRLGFDHPIFSLAVAPGAAARTVLAGTFGALYRGVNTGGGWAWRQVMRTGDAAITSILWAPQEAHRAYASVFAAAPPVLISRDDGRTWRPDTDGLPSTLPTQALLALAPRASQVVLSTMGGGVWLRSAAGRWHDVSAGLPARHAMPLVVAPGSRPAILYAGTMGFGVYAKQGAGPWHRLGHGLSGGAYTVLGLAMTSEPHPILLAGTALGVFRYASPS